MDEHEKFYWGKYRGWTLPALIARLIEAYECNEGRTRKALEFKYLQGRHTKSENQINERVAGALETSNSDSAVRIFAKTLHDANYHASYISLLDSWYRDNRPNVGELNSDIVHEDEWYERSKQEDSDFDRADMLSDPRFLSYLEADAKHYDGDPELKRAYAAEVGLSPELPSLELVLSAYGKQQRERREGFFSNKVRPASIVFWAKEMVGRIGEVSEREDTLSPHVVAILSDAIPQSLRTLFEQAHMTYLFNFDIPCVLSCGALVEEAFEIRYPGEFESSEPKSKSLNGRSFDTSKLGFRGRVSAITKRDPIVARCENHAYRVWGARNKAMHEPQIYLRDGKITSKGVLLDTQYILRILFEADRVEG